MSYQFSGCNGNLIAIDSNYQSIRLVKTPSGKITLYLNNIEQWDTSNITEYHQHLVDLPLSIASKRDKILILGGGDGLPVKHALKFPDVKQICLVEIDKKIIDFTKTNPIMKCITKNAMNSDKVSIIIDNAIKWLKRNKSQFDCIIVDFEFETSPSNQQLLYQFLKDLSKAIKPNGVISFPLYSEDILVIARNRASPFNRSAKKVIESCPYNPSSLISDILKVTKMKGKWISEIIHHCKPTGCEDDSSFFLYLIK